MRNITALLGISAVLLMASNPPDAQSAVHPQPDAGLLVATDAQLPYLQEGIASGDFEPWYPGLYERFSWTRTITEIGGNGLFQVDYAVLDAHHSRTRTAQRLSILLYRPESPPGNGIPVRARAQPLTEPTAGQEASTASTVALRAIEEVLLTTQSYADNLRYYTFSGDTQGLTFTAWLDASFSTPVAKIGAAAHRVNFYLRPARRGRSELILEYAPLLFDVRPGIIEPQQITLATDVSVFRLQYWDSHNWIEQWTQSNSLPPMVQVTLGVGEPRGASQLPHDLSSRIIAVPATVVHVVQNSFTNGPPVQGTNPHLAALEIVEAAFESDASRIPVVKSAPIWNAPGPATRNSSDDIVMEWLGRSGVELARYALAQESSTTQPDSLKQRWAGGPGSSNSPLAAIPLDDYQLGSGSFSIKIVDLDRRFNINVADDVILRQALTLVGVDAGSFPTVVDSILDWRDPDDRPRMAGSESDFYQRLNPPYFAKDGPFDDLSELLLVNGVTPEMYWGSAAVGHSAMLNKPRASHSRFDTPLYEVGLADLFTTTSSRQININTASAKVLQIFPGIDENIANAIINGPGGRAGPDGAEGTEDDTPFRSPQELARIPGFANPNVMATLGRYFTVRSLIFEVRVDVRFNQDRRQLVALLQRDSPRDIRLLNVHWE